MEKFTERMLCWQFLRVSLKNCLQPQRKGLLLKSLLSFADAGFKSLASL